MSDLTPWTPDTIAKAVEAHHWPPPTYWIRDMLTGIVSAWEADRRDAALEKRDKLQRAEENVVLRVRIEALERLAAAEHDRGDYLAGAEPVGGTESLYLRLDAARKEVEALATREKALCRHCGKPESNSKHTRYGPDLDNPVKHEFEPPEQTLPDELTPETLLANPSCSGCGGPHPFDTTVPSVVWNAVIRARHLPDYLCLTCIVKAFVEEGRSFTAELIGGGFHGSPIEIRVNGIVAQDAACTSEENTRLRTALYASEARIAALEREIDVGEAEGDIGAHRLHELRAALRGEEET